MHPNNEYKKISNKYLKYEKRGVSNLYLVKEEIVCAVYVFLTVEESINDGLIETIREENLRVEEMGMLKGCLERVKESGLRK